MFDAKEYHKICTYLNLNYPESRLIVLFFMTLYPKLQSNGSALKNARPSLKILFYKEK